MCDLQAGMTVYGTLRLEMMCIRCPHVPPSMGALKGVLYIFKLFHVISPWGSVFTSVNHSCQFKKIKTHNDDGDSASNVADNRDGWFFLRHHHWQTDTRSLQAGKICTPLDGRSNERSSKPANIIYFKTSVQLLHGLRAQLHRQQIWNHHLWPMINSFQTLALNTCSNKTLADLFSRSSAWNKMSVNQMWKRRSQNHLTSSNAERCLNRT